MGLEYLQSIMIARNFFNLQQICLLSLGTDHVVPFEMTHIDITNIYTRGVTIVDTIDLSRLLQARQSIVDCYFTLSILSPIVETAIDFSDSCLCGLKLISFRRKKTPDVYITVLNIGDLCFVNYEYMFKNSSLKLEKATFS